MVKDWYKLCDFHNWKYSAESNLVQVQVYGQVWRCQLQAYQPTGVDPLPFWELVGLGWTKQAATGYIGAGALLANQIVLVPPLNNTFGAIYGHLIMTLVKLPFDNDIGKTATISQFVQRRMRMIQRRWWRQKWKGRDLLCARPWICDRQSLAINTVGKVDDGLEQITDKDGFMAREATDRQKMRGKMVRGCIQQNFVGSTCCLLERQTTNRLLVVASNARHQSLTRIEAILMLGVSWHASMSMNSLGRGP